MSMSILEHPIVLAPMAGFGTVELAAAVADAGGLGSIGCATMNPQFAVETIARLRRLTSKSININFFCHDPAKADADRERAWHDRLCSYYCELGIDRSGVSVWTSRRLATPCAKSSRTPAAGHVTGEIGCPHQSFLCL
jgi:NAD(P)H-dependent flavin oxidoreductase YrpB (nitropropane dioxygenase family)